MTTARESLASLPDGSSFSPPWRPHEDSHLGDAFIFGGLKSFEIEGLGESLAALDEEAREKFDEIVTYMSDGRKVSRDESELLRRIQQLRK